MADQRAELQPLFARLAQQQRDVGIVAGVEDHVGPGTLQLGDQRGKIGRGRRIAFLHHDVEAGLLGAGLVALRHVDAIGAVLVDDGDAQILRLLAELGLGVLGDEVHRHQAELVAARLRAEHVFVVLVVEHAGGNAGGHPHELLELLDAGGHRHALRRRKEAEQHVDFFLLEQADRLVDGDIGLALGVGIDRLDLVAFDAGLGVLVQHDLGADIFESEPPPASGPVRSKMTPILIFFSCAWAEAAMPSAAIAANSPPSTRAALRTSI